MCVSIEGKYCALLLRWLRERLVPVCSDTGWCDARQRCGKILCFAAAMAAWMACAYVLRHRVV